MKLPFSWLAFSLRPMSSSYAADTIQSTHGGALAALWDRGGACFAAERERWPLWMPVMVGLGIAAYFGVAEEPPPWLGPTVVAGLGVAGLMALWRPIERSPWLRPATAGALAIAAGFTAAQIKALVVDTRMLTERLGPAPVTGLVDNVESLPDGQRVTLHRPTIARLSADKTPAAVRLRLRGAQPTIRAGDAISVRAVLTPPPPPAVPGAYDFQRQAYFDGLGAVGYSVGAATILSAGEDRSRVGVSQWFAPLRTIVTERVAPPRP